MMLLQVLVTLALLRLVQLQEEGIPAPVNGSTSPGDGNQQYVSRKEFEDLTKKCELLEQRLAETKSEVASLQSTTIVILKRLLQENPGLYQQANQQYCEAAVKEIRAALGSSENPAESCKQISAQGTNQSGYYWILNGRTKSASRVYCSMESHCNSKTGGWMRVAYLNMTDPVSTCPPGFRQISSPKRACGRTQRSGGCNSVMFSAVGINYRRVCGKVLGYQSGSPSGFYTPRYSTIEGQYLDGVSVTHGQNPRKHVWSFANALQEAYGYGGNQHICPCRPRSTMLRYKPSFVGNDYFCDTGTVGTGVVGHLYTDDPLWDGQGCDLQPDCCSFHSPPLFCNELPYSTTDDIEVRICADEGFSNEDSPIELIELYVQ